MSHVIKPCDRLVVRKELGGAALLRFAPLLAHLSTAPTARLRLSTIPILALTFDPPFFTFGERERESRKCER